MNSESSKIAQDHNRKLRRYLSLALCIPVVFTFIFLILGLLPAYERLLEAPITDHPIGWIWLLSWLIAAIALLILRKMKEHYGSEDLPPLPYVIRTDRSVFYVLTGIVLVLTLLLLRFVQPKKSMRTQEGLEVPSEVVLSFILILWVVWFGGALLIHFLDLNTYIILRENGIWERKNRRERGVLYSQIRQIDVQPIPRTQSVTGYEVEIRHNGEIPSPFRFFLDLYPKRDWFVILKTLSDNAPEAKLGTLAEEMKQGCIPAL